MILGFYPFMVDTLAYEELTETVSFEWAEQKRIGSYPAMHYTGQNARVRQLRGKLCPPFTGTHANIYRMHAMGELTMPLMLIAGSGLVFGRWVIESVEDVGRYHTTLGAPRLTEWNVRIKKYDDGAGLFGALTKLSKAVSLIR